MSVRSLVELWSALFRPKPIPQKTESKEDDISSFKSLHVEESMEYFDSVELVEGRDSLSSGRSTTSEITPGATWKHVGSSSRMDTLELLDEGIELKGESADGSDTPTIICLHDQLNQSVSLELEKEDNIIINPSINNTEDTFDTQSRYVDVGRDDDELSDDGSVIFTTEAGVSSVDCVKHSTDETEAFLLNTSHSCRSDDDSTQEGSVVFPGLSAETACQGSGDSNESRAEGSVVYPQGSSSSDTSAGGSLVMLPHIDVDESQMNDLQWDRIPSEESHESFTELARPTSVHSVRSPTLESIGEHEEMRSFRQVRDTRDSVETVDSFIDYAAVTDAKTAETLNDEPTEEQSTSPTAHAEAIQSPPSDGRHLNALQVADSKTKYRPSGNSRHKPDYAMTYPSYQQSSADSPKSQSSDLTEGSSPKRRFARGPSSQSRSRQFLLQNLLERAKSSNSVTTTSSEENPDSLRYIPTEDPGKKRVQFSKEEVSGVSISQEVLSIEDLQDLFYTDEEANVFKDDYDNEYQVAAALDLSWYDWMHQESDATTETKSISS